MSGSNPSEFVLTNIPHDDFINRIADAVVLRLKSDPLPTQPKEQAERKITLDEVLELLKVSKSTLRNWEHQGILKPVRMGHRVYYLYSDIVNAGNKVKAV